MTSPDYSTTRRLTSEKPACFDIHVDGMQTLLKTPDSEKKIAEGGLRLQGLYKSNSEDKPLITVVTVVFNGADFLEETIKSVIEQTYDNVEYIIVDGGSTDGTLEIIKKYDHAIDYWVSEPDKGIYDAMNKGIQLSTGYIIGLINSDDYYNLKALDVISSSIEQSIDVYYGGITFIKEGLTLYISPADDLNKFKRRMSVFHPSVFVKRSVYNKRRYDEGFKIAADFELLSYLYLSGFVFRKVDNNISYFRDGGASSNMSFNNLKENIIVRVRNRTFPIDIKDILVFLYYRLKR